MARGRHVHWAPLQTADPRTTSTATDAATTSSLSPLSSHQILACVLAQWRATSQQLGSTQQSISRMDAFFSSLPTDFDTMPLTWMLDGRTHLLDALPPSAVHKFASVRTRYENDWSRVRSLDSTTLESLWASVGLPGTRAGALNERHFAWGWLCTNSRCVYMDLHYVKHEDNFTLAPLLDMANHTALRQKECTVRYSAVDGMELCAPPESSLQAGEAVCITYGPHDNATLLVEYGFVLPRNVNANRLELSDQVNAASSWHGNPHASVWLDEAVDRLIESQGAAGEWKRSLLQKEGYWGYVRGHIVVHVTDLKRLHIASEA